MKDFFSKWIPKGSVVLDLGCGYGEFINNVPDCERHAMDLNPDSGKHFDKDFHFHQQDCSKPWGIAPRSLDVIFSSNFFEHLPDKDALDQTVGHAMQALKPGGSLLAIGPNIAVLKGRYWDFWDHHIALSDQALAELLEIHGLEIKRTISRFLPYNMVRVKKRPLFLVSLYLRAPFLWPIWGKQFFLAATKP
jgi:SAM-dependent methyltransferase